MDDFTTALSTAETAAPSSGFVLGKKIRRSMLVGLVLIGSISCGQKETWRDEYTSKEDCLADWGDGTQCEPVARSGHTTSTGTHSSAYRYYGPVYTGSNDRVAQQRHYNSGFKVGSPSRASGSVSRGGFGHSASSHSGGG
ncbi:MAG: hypothetical protein RLZZ502_697 [Pseudomonadota bacterium]|jgi:hypothetical protein